MTVRVFGRLRKVLGAEIIEVDAVTVGEARSLLSARLAGDDELARAMLDNAVVLVNGRNAHALGGDAAPLAADDEMTVLQQIAGG
jgi:molybdopterin converting factor small subunit